MSIFQEVGRMYMSIFQEEAMRARLQSGSKVWRATRRYYPLSCLQNAALAWAVL